MTIGLASMTGGKVGVGGGAHLRRRTKAQLVIPWPCEFDPGARRGRPGAAPGRTRDVLGVYTVATFSPTTAAVSRSTEVFSLRRLRIIWPWFITRCRSHTLYA